MEDILYFGVVFVVQLFEGLFVAGRGLKLSGVFVGLGVKVAIGVDWFFGYFLDILSLEPSLSGKFEFLAVGVGMPYFIFILIPIFLSLVEPLMVIYHFLCMFYTFFMMILISRRNLLMIVAILGIDSVVRDG